MTILLTLSSPQTIPSVLFIQQFREQADAFYFLTTPWSEQQRCTEAIITACDLPLSKCRIYTCRGEDVASVQQAIIDMQIDEHTVLANINGGTKIMALGTFAQLTSGNPRSEIYYLPLDGKNHIRIYPTAAECTAKTSLSLKQYLDAYDLDIVKAYRVDTIPHRLADKSRHIIKHIIVNNAAPLDVRKAQTRDYKEKDKHFLLGGWLELYMAGAIQRMLSLPDDHIAYNVKLTRTAANDNEFTEYDILYMYNNVLHVVECKYFWGRRGAFSKRFILKEWYKLAGLRQDFGITCKSYFATANVIAPGMRGYLDKTLPVFNISGAIDITTIGNKDRLQDYLTNI